MNKIISFTLIVLLLVSCNTQKNKKVQVSYNQKLEKTLSVDTTFAIGDVRRYGIKINKGIGVHPKTKQKILDELFRLSATGLTIKFPKGYYKTSLIIKNQKKVSFDFDNASFSGSIQLIDSDSISLKGKINSYSSFVINNGTNINLGQVTILANKELNIAKIDPSGFQILNKSENININTITISGLGAGEPFKYTPSALKIYGFPKTPNNITINKVTITDSPVNGAIIMANEVNIKDITIQKFGYTTVKTLKKLSNTKIDPNDFVGLWLVKNTNSTYENVTITNGEKPALRLEKESFEKVTIIENLILHSKLTEEQAIADDERTNVVIKKIALN